MTEACPVCHVPERYGPDCTCVDPKKDKCPHDDFHAQVDVKKLEDIGRIVVDIRIKCRTCNLPFQFVGLPIGLDMGKGAWSSLDGLEASLAICPEGEEPKPIEGVVGYSVKISRGEEQEEP